MIKATIKKLINAAIMKFSLINLSTSKIVILRYHSVQKNPDLYDCIIGRSITHSLDEFEEQMEAIASDFNPISIDDLHGFLKKKIRIPKKAVVITFDDGFYDNYEYAVPILNRLGIPATFYISVNCIQNSSIPWFSKLRYCFFNTVTPQWEDPIEHLSHKLNGEESRLNAFIKACRQCTVLVGQQQSEYIKIIKEQLEISGYPYRNLMMSWDQIGQLLKMGHTIGSHTMSHPNLAYIDKASLIWELKESKNILEGKLNKPIFDFSYPNPALIPNYNQLTYSVVKDSGYRSAVTCDPGPVKRNDDVLLMKRMYVPNNLNEFLWYLNMSFIGRTI